ncbi:MAG: hypothetical protein K0B11_18515 [Mariniphaga sp.]|nr:hypothetical protein [Mariniphaga sp.]
MKKPGYRFILQTEKDDPVFIIVSYISSTAEVTNLLTNGGSKIPLQAQEWNHGKWVYDKFHKKRIFLLKCLAIAVAFFSPDSYARPTVWR